MNNVRMLEELGIDLKRKQAGQVKTTCPNCSESRGKNKKDPCLSVDIEEGLYNCHHCGWHGRVFEKQKKEYVKPPARLEKLGKQALDWFENTRMISNNTLLRLGITESLEFMPQLNKEVTTICFNYYRGEDLVNIKFRSADKAFKLAKDAELIFYNLNALQGEETAIIVEGEIDCLSLVDCGIYNVVSVPNGASKGNQKLEYLDNCWQYFTNIKKIILAVDDDEAGRSLREELARRLGKDKCWQVEYPSGCKDSNEVLCQHGPDALKKMITNATEWPLEGIMTMEDMFSEVTDYWENGYPPGAKANIPGFDDLLTFAAGQLTVVTGIPGHGKDEFLNWITTSLATQEGWKWGVCAFEEEPPYTTTKLIEKFKGKSFAFRKNKESRLTQQEYEHGVYLVDQHFFFLNIQQIDATMDGILKKAEELVKRKGIKGLIINPWNCLEHKVPFGYSETQYISEELTRLINFLQKFGLHGFLVAHPTKMQKVPTGGKNAQKKYEIPTLYNISGSAHFFNKTHNGICVYRDMETNQVEVHVQKVKWSWLGKVGWSSYSFNTETRQYSFQESSVKKQIEHPEGSTWRSLAGTIPAPPVSSIYESDDDENEEMPF